MGGKEVTARHGAQKVANLIERGILVDGLSKSLEGVAPDALYEINTKAISPSIVSLAEGIFDVQRVELGGEVRLSWTCSGGGFATVPTGPREVQTSRCILAIEVAAAAQTYAARAGIEAIAVEVEEPHQ